MLEDTYFSTEIDSELYDKDFDSIDPYGEIYEEVDNGDDDIIDFDI